ncbi:MAG: hypothetical protein JWM21_1301 [Acidobacteria bacterium]|nr:hypothetical protein [Acidobacteriota bacterium]
MKWHAHLARVSAAAGLLRRSTGESSTPAGLPRRGPHPPVPPARWQRAVPGHDLGALVVIVFFFLAFFHRVIFSDKFLVTSDAFNYLYPLRTIVWQEVRHGRLPLWTPQIMSGYPLLSMAQIGIGYPLTWSYLFLPGRWAEQIYFLAPYLLAPAFTYAYLREINRTRLAALLGALAFGYGGFMISPLASYSGLAANATMWLPLMLLVIERARSRRFVSSALAATGVYAMSVLSGWGQGFAYVGLLAVSYAVVVAVVGKSEQSEEVERSRKGEEEARKMRAVPGAVAESVAGSVAGSVRGWRRWRPLGVVLVAMVLAAGVDAFQILETMQVQRLSIRRELTYQLFAMGSYKLNAAAKSFLLPLHTVFEASTYVATLALVPALIAVIASARVSVHHFRRNRSAWQGRSARECGRIIFWSAVAMLGFTLMLGENTPVASVLYHIPPFNLFRGAARHAFEFTFSVSILSAYGWDKVDEWSIAREHRTSRRSPWLYWGVAFLILALAAGLLWVRDISQVPVGYMEIFYYPPQFSESRYLFWKLSFSFLTIVAAWCLLKAPGSRRRGGLLLSTIAVACFFEPAIMASRWWWPTLKPASRFTAVSQPTNLLRNYPPAENRIYTHVYPMVEEYADPPRLEPANLTMLYGLQNVAGNEPLILDRYSRALGDVYIDAVKTRPGYPSDPTLLTSTSHVLDLLNTRFLVSYANLATEPWTLIERDGIRIDPRDLGITVEPGKTITLKGVAAAADTLALITATAWSAEAVDGTEVARVRLISPHGRVIERLLRVGIDTAEWAHDRRNVRPLMRHSLATVLSSKAEDLSDHEPAYKFITRLALGARLQVDRIEISNVSKKIVLLLAHATLFDSINHFSMPLPHYDLEKWQPVYDHDGALVLRNQKALPRVWLVAEAEVVAAEEALQRIRGQGKPFDPRRTALLEIDPRELPALPGGPIAAAAGARIAAQESNRLVIETNAETASVLVVSEVNYPGWVATVDGARAPIHATDFLLRGVVLPAGSHRVEMRYTAPAARWGALISVCTLIVIGGLLIYARRTHTRSK